MLIYLSILISLIFLYVALVDDENVETTEEELDPTNSTAAT